MGNLFSGQPGGNPRLVELGAPYRFKPGNPGAKPGRAGISARRLRQMMREAVPAVAAVQLLGVGIEALRPLVIGQCYRRLTGDVKQTDAEWAAAERLLPFLFSPLGVAPQPAPAEPKVDPYDLLRALHGKAPDGSAEA